jgi:hypothetical protein
MASARAISGSRSPASRLVCSPGNVSRQRRMTSTNSSSAMRNLHDLPAGAVFAQCIWRKDPLRHTREVLIYRRTGNLRTVQRLLQTAAATNEELSLHDANPASGDRQNSLQIPTCTPPRPRKNRNWFAQQLFTL